MTVIAMKRPTVKQILARAAQLHITFSLDDERERLVVSADDPAVITEQARRVFTKREAEIVAIGITINSPLGPELRSLDEAQS